MRHLILGGARSGKSRYGEETALQLGHHWLYLATGQARDEEMRLRIAHHQHQRSPLWQVVEEPHCLADTMTRFDRPDGVILVDCMTLWLSNTLDDGVFEAQKSLLLQVLPTLQSEVLLVANEIGAGVVPLGEQTRRFVDECGWLNQTLAQVCERVTLVVAGLPLTLKG